MQDQEKEVRTYAQMLQDGLDEVVSREPFQRFLRFVANNPNYSARNVLLILQQRPNATQTKGFKGWLKANRCVNEGEHGIRINANFQAEDPDDPVTSPAMHREKEKKKDEKEFNFRRISIFDISQTSPLDGVAGNTQPSPAPAFGNTNPFKTELLEGQVQNYELALQILKMIAPSPIVFRHGIRSSAAANFSEITLKSDMSQLQAIRSAINQITQIWRRPFCMDQDQLEIEAESVAFIVCRHLGLDTSGFSFPHIAQYSFGKERKNLKLFLNAIQQTALYFIDSIDGLLEADRIGYASSEYFMLVNPRTAMRLFREGQPVYLVYPGKGELLTINKKAIEKHDGPFATDWDCWFQPERWAA